MLALVSFTGLQAEYSTAIAYAHYSLGGIYDYNNYKNATYYGTLTNLMYVRPVRAF